MKQSICVSFSVDSAYCSPREERVRTVFGLPRKEKQIELLKDFEIPSAQMTYITGYSGGGKSSILQEIQKIYPHAISIEDMHPPKKKVIDIFDDGSDAEVIQWLSRFGLGEARVLVTPSQYLSAGQLARLKLAMLLRKRPEVVVIDEFLSYLDRTTARVIAYQFQKIARSQGVKVFVATAHDDLADALLADLTLTVDFLGKIIMDRPLWQSDILKEKREILIEDGSLEDYQRLKHFHYMDAQQQDGGEDSLAQTVVAVQRAVFRGKIVGVRVFSKPYPNSFEKIKVFKIINQNVLLSSRVIVHPSFRGLGISSLLASDHLIPTGFKVLCTHSALELYFPFDLGSGHQKTCHPSRSPLTQQLELSSLLKGWGLDQPSDLHDWDQANEFWQSLDQQQQARLFALVQEILSAYDLNVLNYYCSLIGLPSAPHQESFAAFFCQYHQRRSIEESPLLLNEALFFPMQGLAKSLNPSSLSRIAEYA